MDSRRFCLLTIIALLVIQDCLAEELDSDHLLATVSYRRSPSFYNGEHVTGVWRLKAGDVVSTGDGRAYVTAQYADSTRASAIPNSKVAFYPQWLDVQAGGMDIDVVSGTQHLQQVETPLGILRLVGTTGSFAIAPPQKETGEKKGDSMRQIRFIGRHGQFIWQIARPPKSASPPMTVVIDEGDRVIVDVSSDGGVASLHVTNGEVEVRVADDMEVTIPTKGRGTVRCLPEEKTLAIVSIRGELQVKKTEGKPTIVESEGSLRLPLPTTWPESIVLKSLRGAASQIAGSEIPSTSPSSVPVERKSPYPNQLPQQHAYQRTLRDYLAQLTEEDLDPGTLELTVAPPATDTEYLYRNWLLSLDRVPRIGRKRSAPSVSAPARLFLLKNIEGPESIMRPPAWPEPLAWFANWNYPGNPYFGSRALKLRSFVTAAVLLTMVDHLQETAPEVGVSRTDQMSLHLELFAYTYPQVRDVLPPRVQSAYETGLRKIVDRMLAWGPGNHNVAMELAACVGLYYAAEALDDAELRQTVKDYSRQFFTDPEYFHPAGYFVSQGGYDAAYNGQARFYAVWLALASDYDFIRDPLSRAYRLRGHLSLPEPDGTFTGPCQFNMRTSRDAYHDQYEWPFRDHGAAMLTDEAAHLTKLPTSEELASGGQLRIKEFVTQIKENPGYAKPQEITTRPWSFRPWPNSWSFPQPFNYAQVHYRQGSYTHRAKLEKEQSPLLKLPVLREGSYLRSFEKAFAATRQEQYAAIVHTGPVATALPTGSLYPAGPFGLGGGQLSAFWTPASGSVILGRRGGLSSEAYDSIEQWRMWPQHAVSGLTVEGKVLTTGRIRFPKVTESLDGSVGTIQVRGVIPITMLEQGRVLTAPLQYGRKFSIATDTLRVETRIDSEQRDTLAELVETIPVYLRDLQSQRKQLPTRIEFCVDSKWEPATNVYKDGITAIRLHRFDGQVQIDFARPRRVKLSASDWHDTYMSRAACRNILIDLIENGDQPKVFTKAEVAYTIRPL